MSESEASGTTDVTQEKNNIAAKIQQQVNLLHFYISSLQFKGIKRCELQPYKLHGEQWATFITIWISIITETNFCNAIKMHLNALPAFGQQQNKSVSQELRS